MLVGLDYISQRAWQSGGLLVPAAPGAGNNAAGCEPGGPSGLPSAGAPLDREPSVQLLPGCAPPDTAV